MLTQEESDQLLQLCQEAAEAHVEMSDTEGAETVYTALLGYLRSQGWQDQVAEIEHLMRETLGTNPPKRPRPPAAATSAMPPRGGRRGAVEPRYLAVRDPSKRPLPVCRRDGVLTARD